MRPCNKFRLQPGVRTFACWASWYLRKGSDSHSIRNLNLEFTAVGSWTVFDFKPTEGNEKREKAAYCFYTYICSTEVFSALEDLQGSKNERREKQEENKKTDLWALPFNRDWNSNRAVSHNKIFELHSGSCENDDLNT